MLTSNAEFRGTRDTDRLSVSNAVKAHLPRSVVVSLGERLKSSLPSNEH